MRTSLALMISILLLVLSGCSQSQVPSGVESSESGLVQTYTIEAIEHSFTPALISVSKGTILKVHLVNRGEKHHEWELEGYDVEIRPIAPGATGVLTLVADKVGTFRFVCDIDDHYEKGMRGFLIVTEPQG